MEEGGHTTMGEGDHYELILEEKVFGNYITMERNKMFSDEIDPLCKGLLYSLSTSEW